MTPPAGARRLLPLAAVAGVVAGHAVDYLVLFPSDTDRARYLQATGHGYWPLAAALAVVAGIGALALAAARGARGVLGRRGVAPEGGWPACLAQLAGWQMALFTVLELVERAAAGTGPAAFLRSPEFAVGLLLQVAVASVTVALLAAAGRVAERVVGALRDRPAPRRPSVAVPVGCSRPRGARVRGRAPARAPPSPA